METQGKKYAKYNEVGLMYNNNPLYYQLFNPEYVNEEYIRQLQQQQHDAEQQKEILNVVKAIHDYFNAARKISPDYQQIAFNACIATIVKEMSNWCNIEGIRLYGREVMNDKGLVLEIGAKTID